MEEYTPKDSRKAIQFIIFQPKKSWQEHFLSFFKQLFNCLDFDINHEKQICELLAMDEKQLPCFKYVGGQVDQEIFERAFARFNRLEWLFSEFGNIVQNEHFLTWIKTPCPFLGEKKPIEFLVDDEKFQSLQTMFFHLSSGTPS